MEKRRFLRVDSGRVASSAVVEQEETGRQRTRIIYLLWLAQTYVVYY